LVGIKIFFISKNLTCSAVQHQDMFNLPTFSLLINLKHQKSKSILKNINYILHIDIFYILFLHKNTMSDDINLFNPQDNLKFLAPFSYEEALKILSDQEKEFHRATPEDLGIIARIKTMTPEDFKACDKFFPKPEYHLHYLKLHTEWIKREDETLKHNLRRESRAYREEDLLADMTQQKICPRFRAYYLMKYPDKMRKI
jgi:hypothetical protein